METILLIEDTSAILENLTEYLELEGYKIVGATNGKMGIELAKKYIPDLIVCDVLMPDMDGHAVLRLLLEGAITSSIPFIFSTSMAEKIDRAEALRSGAVEYLVKPFEPEVLLQVIRKCLKSRNNKARSVST